MIYDILSLRQAVLTELREHHCNDTKAAYSLALELMLAGLTPSQAVDHLHKSNPSLFAASLGEAAAALNRAGYVATFQAMRAVLHEAVSFARTCDEAVRWLSLRGDPELRRAAPGNEGGSGVPSPSTPPGPSGPLTCAACVPAPAPEEVIA